MNKLYNVSMAYRPGRVVYHQLMSRKTTLSGWHSVQHLLTITLWEYRGSKVAQQTLEK